MKLKKYLSCFVAAATILSTVSFVAYAENVTVTGYDADPDGIIIYTSEATTANELKSALSVTEDDNDVEFEVADIKSIESYGIVTRMENKKNFKKQYAYKIIKTDNQKLTDDKIYKILIYTLISTLVWWI